MNKLLSAMMYPYMAEADGGDGLGKSSGGSGTPENKGEVGDNKTGDESGKGDASGAKDGDSGAKKSGPTDEEARLLKDVMRKKDELRRAQEEITSLKNSIEGLDLGEVRKMLSERAQAETKALEEKGDYERLRQRMAEEHGKLVKDKDARIAELEASLKKAGGTIDELTIGTQFGQSGLIEELTLSRSKARMLFGAHFDVQEDGSVVGYDKPRGAAGRTAFVDQYGTPVNFDEALRKIVDADPDRETLYKSKTRPGAGSDSRKAGERQQEEISGSVNRIAAGLKGLNLPR